LLIKYIKSVLWRVAKLLSYKEDARCLKVKIQIPIRFYGTVLHVFIYVISTLILLFFFLKMVH